MPLDGAPGRLLLGIALSTAIGLLAYRRGSLSRSGVGGAILTGALIFGLGGFAWAVLVVLFFASSSALSHWQAARKTAVAEKFAKGSRRDLAQTLANGGVGALLAVGNALHPDPIWLAAFVGAMAAVTADTWATEIGVLSASPPRLITTLRPVAAGTSGGITPLGTLAALAGGVFIGVSAWLLAALGGQPGGVLLLAVGSVVGVVSALFDSLLGATVQHVYECRVCGQATERRFHHGQPTRPLHGWPWLDNEGVNFLASLVGALLGGWWGAGRW